MEENNLDDNNENEQQHHNSSLLEAIVDNVKVCVRIRPNTFGHATANLSNMTCVSAMVNKNAVLLDCKPNQPKVFTFDYVANEHSTQHEIFQSISLPTCNSFINGYNGTIFAYGQSGSGKTYTLSQQQSQQSTTTDNRGIIPRTFEYLFNQLNNNKQQFKCTLSYIEIYNEQIFNLLQDNSTTTSLSIREDLKKGIYIEGLKQHDIKSSNEAMKLFEQGIRNRSIGETALNSNSSRSHSVLTINLSTCSIADGNKRYSRLSIIDLAGSERQKQTESTGNRLKEAGSINKSLSVLGNVIRSLVELSNGKPRHIPYRDSKLTFLLRDSLGGNSKTFIIATVSPSESCFGETLSTLQFAQRAKHVKNVAIMNEESSGNLALLQMEISKLKEELYKLVNSGQSSTNTTSSSTTSTSTSINSQADNLFEKRLFDLQVQLSRSLDREEMLTLVNENQTSKIKTLKLLIEKKDHFLLNTKLVLKLRESHISRLEGKLERVISSREDELLDEIYLLSSQVSLHPEVTRYAIENIELRQKVSSYESNFTQGTDNYQEQLSSYKQQIHELVTEVNTLLKERQQFKINNNNNNNNNTSTTSTTSTLTPYLDRKKQKEIYECKQFEWEIEKEQMNKDYQTLQSKMISLSSENQALKISLNESNSKLKEFANNSFSNNTSNQDLLNRLFEKDFEISRLKFDLNSSQISNETISEIFISTPLKQQIKEKSNSRSSNKPIKFDLNLNENSEKDNEIIQLNNQLNEYIANQQNQLNQITELEESLNVKSLEINYLLSKQQPPTPDEIETILKNNEIKEKESIKLTKIIESLQNEISGKNCQLMELSCLNENLNHSIKEEKESTIHQIEMYKSKIIQAKLDNATSSSSTNTNIGSSNEQQLQQQIQELKTENHEIIDKIDQYQSQVSDFYMELNEKDNEINLLNMKIEVLNSKLGELANIDVVILSSGEEDESDQEKEEKEEEEEESYDPDKPVVFCKPYYSQDEFEHHFNNNNSFKDESDHSDHSDIVILQEETNNDDHDQNDHEMYNNNNNNNNPYNVKSEY